MTEQFPPYRRHSFVEVTPARNYGRPLAANVFGATAANDEVLRWLYATIAADTAECPPEGYVSLSDCFIYEGQYIVTPDLEWFEPSIIDYGPKDDVLPVLRSVIRGEHYARLDQLDRSWSYVVIAKHGAPNYGHFLTDIAPKLINLKKAGLGRVRIIYPDTGNLFLPIVSDVCAAIGLEAEIVPAPSEKLIRASDVLFFTPVAMSPSKRKSPTLLELRDIMYGMYGVTPTPRRRFLICREPYEKRRLSNQSALIDTLAARGFEPVYPGRLSFQQQVRLFAQASHIVGSCGAGLTNSLFASTKTNVTYISPCFIDTFFWDLATLCGQRFSWVFTAPLDHWSQAASLQNYAVDVCACLHALDQIDPPVGRNSHSLPFSPTAQRSVARPAAANP